MEMIQYNIGALDKELNPFTQEMKERNEAGFEATLRWTGHPRGGGRAGPHDHGVHVGGTTSTRRG